MTPRENLISLFKRKGYERAPVQFDLCPLQNEKFQQEIGNNNLNYTEYYKFPYRSAGDMTIKKVEPKTYIQFYDKQLKKGTNIDIWGVAREPGSKECMHMNYMLHPMEKFDSLEQFKTYPFPDYLNGDNKCMKEKVDSLHKKGLASCGIMACTLWEIGWYLRGMEQLMVDMMTESIMAEYLFEKLTNIACVRAAAYAKAGADLILLGDDIGMQHTIMMSEEMYCTWIKPRMIRIIEAAKKIKPDIIIMYHSCGYIEPFIPHLIEEGIDVLNPIQPECMSFEKIHSEYKDVLSFFGTIGTQSVMPFGTPDDVKNEVIKNLKIAGSKGGLLCAPTHLIEPEVPWENIMAYVKTCRAFMP